MNINEIIGTYIECQVLAVSTHNNNVDANSNIQIFYVFDLYPNKHIESNLYATSILLIPRKEYRVCRYSTYNKIEQQSDLD